MGIGSPVFIRSPVFTFQVSAFSYQLQSPRSGAERDNPHVQGVKHPAQDAHGYSFQKKTNRNEYWNA